MDITSLQCHYQYRPAEMKCLKFGKEPALKNVLLDVSEQVEDLYTANVAFNAWVTVTQTGCNSAKKKAGSRKRKVLTVSDTKHTKQKYSVFSDTTTFSEHVYPTRYMVKYMQECNSSPPTNTSTKRTRSRHAGRHECQRTPPRNKRPGPMTVMDSSAWTQHDNKHSDLLVCPLSADLNKHKKQPGGGGGKDSDQLPSIIHYVPIKRYSIESVDSLKSLSSSLILLNPTRDMYYTVSNQSRENGTRDNSVISPNCERKPHDPYQEQPPPLGLQHQFLPVVKNTKNSWSVASSTTPGRPAGALQRFNSAFLKRGADLNSFTRTSSAGSRSSSGTEFKGKLQNYLHPSSDKYFKKLPCGLVYGKGLKSKIIKTSKSGHSLDLSIKSV